MMFGQDLVNNAKNIKSELQRNTIISQGRFFL